MFPSTIRNPNTFSFEVFLVLLLIFSNSQTDSHPEPRGVDHCAFAYENRFYVFGGGVANNGNNSDFSYINTPFNVSEPAQWNSLPISKVVDQPACSVTSNGILYVTGGTVPHDNKYAGIQSFDLKKDTLGSWYTPNTKGLNTSQHLSRRGHKSIVVQTSEGEEVLFIFGGSESNDAFILNVKSSIWETITEGPDAPPPMDIFAMTFSKDNIYIIGPLTSGKNLWAFHIPKKIWFNPQTTVNIPVNARVEYAGKLNDTIYLMDSGDSSSMWKWNLVDNSTTFFTPPDYTEAGFHYALAQLPGSDVFITYGGKTGSKATDSLAAFNMTQNAWVTQVNKITNIPNDQYRGGLLAPGQEDPFSKPPQKSTINTGNKTDPTKIGLVDILCTVESVILIMLFIVIIVLAWRSYRRRKDRKEAEAEELTIVDTCEVFGNNAKICSQREDIETGCHRVSEQTYRPPNIEASVKCNSISSNTTVRTSNHTVKLNSTPSTPSSLLNELRILSEMAMTTTFESSSSSLVSPSAPEGTILFDRYKLEGKPKFDVSESVRYAEDVTVSEAVAVKFFSDYDSFNREVTMLKFLRSKFVGALRDAFHVPDAAVWKYAMTMDYYSMSLDVFIHSRKNRLDDLYMRMVVKSIAQAIQYVHNHEIVHLDIHPGNFVHEVYDVNKWRLIDFESARVDGKEDVGSSTLRYAPPELVKAGTCGTNIKADTSMDMWSFGCTIYELCTGSPLFLDDNEATARLLDAYDTQHFEFPIKKVPDVQAQHILENLLVVNPMKRVSVEEILKGAYLTGGADNTQIYNMQSESTERIINSLNKNTSVVFSVQEAINIIGNSISDTRDAIVPRLFMLLSEKKAHTVFKPKTWGKNTFVLHLLCEGYASDNSEAHFTDHPGYMIYNARPFLAKAGPYLSILVDLIGSAAGFFTGLQLPDRLTDAIFNIRSCPVDYFKKIDETDGDSLNKMKYAQGPALRELEAFLSENDPLREYGGLHRITMSDGRWRWVCNSCRERAYHSHGNHGC
ncbi:10027_t:CDS:2 [Paraglomus occultum]|uniref:10027_t:CDS:1 n=1 Tax=Paraglomus occultum TaxID=144539 RepID=A0A9N9AQM1_9GLOM|nr:10027_t:CDS:2 [Paraglomus occultum]